MSLPLPRLDDRTYDDLLEEARALIPAFAPEWTDHNPSDPGITLVELFAWLTDMLIYRINRQPEEQTRTFLRLLNGPDWVPGPDLAEDIRATVLDLRRRHRAVTADDYEYLAREASPKVARVRAVPKRNLGSPREADRVVLQEGYVSLILVPAPEEDEPRPEAPLPSQELLAAVEEHLAPRRLLTVRQVVAAPVYVPIQAEVVLARRPDAPLGEEVQKDVADALKGFLHPLSGGPEGEGWPFGRDVFVSEIYQLLERVPGVDFVTDVHLESRCPRDAERCAEGEPLWHDGGDFIGIGLAPHHLPWAQIDFTRVVVGTSFVPVQVTVTVEPGAGLAPAAARRTVKSAVRRILHPLHGGPSGGQAQRITDLEILGRLIPQATDMTVRKVEISAAPDRLFREQDADEREVRGFRLQGGELVDLTVTVILEGEGA